MNETIFSALAEPNRLHIVELLRTGPLSVGEIAYSLGLNQPQASKQLRVLSDAGLVEMKADANRRIYKLCPKPLIALNAWLDSFHLISDERQDLLDDYLQGLLK
jgi:DNA-binding transcriptional ArsR family regulator